MSRLEPYKLSSYLFTELKLVLSRTKRSVSPYYKSYLMYICLRLVLGDKVVRSIYQTLHLEETPVMVLSRLYLLKWNALHHHHPRVRYKWYDESLNHVSRDVLLSLICTGKRWMYIYKIKGHISFSLYIFVGHAFFLNRKWARNNIMNALSGA